MTERMNTRRNFLSMLFAVALAPTLARMSGQSLAISLLHREDFKVETVAFCLKGAMGWMRLQAVVTDTRNGVQNILRTGLFPGDDETTQRTAFHMLDEAVESSILERIQSA